MAAERKYLRLVFCGDSFTGKKVLIHRFHKKELKYFPYSTIGADFCNQNIKLNNDAFKMQIW